MDAKRLALVEGLQDTRETLDLWNRRPGPVLREWVLASAATAIALLVGVDLIASWSAPDPSPLHLPGLGARSSFADAASLFGRNLLVLALHAMACVAGFIAGSSVPRLAGSYRGLARIVHERAGPLAIAFVIGATTFSLCTQAYILGTTAATLAYHLHMSPALLIVGLLPHALPELTALFLPLAAWVLASRRGEWRKLLAATVVTVAIALPVLAISALVEVYVSPHLVAALSR